MQGLFIFFFDASPDAIVNFNIVYNFSYFYHKIIISDKSFSPHTIINRIHDMECYSQTKQYDPHKMFIYTIREPYPALENLFSLLYRFDKAQTDIFTEYCIDCLEVLQTHLYKKRFPIVPKIETYLTT